MPSWVVGAGTIVISLVSAYGFLMLRCRGTGNPFGRRARWWAAAIVLITAAVSSCLGLAAIAVGDHAIAACVGLILPSGLWLARSSGLHSRLDGSRLAERLGVLGVLATFPLRRLDDRMGDDLQDWCDVRLRAASRKPQWVSDAADYYYNQVSGLLRDKREKEQLSRWRESVRHKIGVVHLIDAEASPASVAEALRYHPATTDRRTYDPDDLPRLARRLMAEAENELCLFLARVYRLGYHRLLIFPFRPQPLPRAQPAPGSQAAASREPRTS